LGSAEHHRDPISYIQDSPFYDQSNKWFNVNRIKWGDYKKCDVRVVIGVVVQTE
jgi:hypothetical protein